MVPKTGLDVKDCHGCVLLEVAHHGELSGMEGNDTPSPTIRKKRGELGGERIYGWMMVTSNCLEMRKPSDEHLFVAHFAKMVLYTYTSLPGRCLMHISRLLL